MTEKLPASGGSYVREDNGDLKKAEPSKPASPKPTKKKG